MPIIMANKSNTTIYSQIKYKCKIKKIKLKKINKTF